VVNAVSAKLREPGSGDIYAPWSFAERRSVQRRMLPTRERVESLRHDRFSALRAAPTHAAASTLETTHDLQIITLFRTV